MSQITKEQRYTISVMKNNGFSQKEIAESIGKDKSTVSRELNRNCDKRSKEYRFEKVVTLSFTEESQSCTEFFFSVAFGVTSVCLCDRTLPLRFSYFVKSDETLSFVFCQQIVVRDS